MKTKIVISPPAGQDIKENTLWYNIKRKGLGKAFAFEIRKTVKYITDYPTAFPIKYYEMRVATVEVFPFSVHYFYDQPNKTVFISCVFRNSRDPETTKSRVV